MLPEGWDHTKFGEVFKSSRTKGNSGLPTLSVTLTDGLVARDSIDRKMDTSLEAHEHLLVRRGDIAYNMMRMWQGASGLAMHDAVVSPAYVVLRAKNTIDPLFASYLFKLPRTIHNFWAYSYGITDDRLRLYFKDFAAIPVNLPPIAEQRKIAEILFTWDKAIASQEKLAANARAQKKALIQQLLTGKKRLPGFQGEWVNLEFDEVFIVDNNKRTQVQSSRYQAQGQTPVVDQGQEFIVGYTDQRDIYDSVPAIVFGDHTRVAKWIDFPFCPGADGTQILKSKPTTHLRFAFYLLVAASIPNLGYSRHMRALRNLPFSVPSDLQEQKNLANLLCNADEQVHLLEKALLQLKSEKSALMQLLLTGKRRVKVEDRHRRIVAP